MENKVLKLGGGGGDPPKIYLLPSIGVTLGDGLSNPRKLNM